MFPCHETFVLLFALLAVSCNPLSILIACSFSLKCLRKVILQGDQVL